MQAFKDGYICRCCLSTVVLLERVDQEGGYNYQLDRANVEYESQLYLLFDGVFQAFTFIVEITTYTLG